MYQCFCWNQTCIGRSWSCHANLAHYRQLICLKNQTKQVSSKKTEEEVREGAGGKKTGRSWFVRILGDLMKHSDFELPLPKFYVRLGYVAQCGTFPLPQMWKVLCLFVTFRFIDVFFLCIAIMEVSRDEKLLDLFYVFRLLDLWPFHTFPSNFYLQTFYVK